MSSPPTMVLVHGAFAESKLNDVMLAFAIARRWRDVLSNSLEPGWVATKMGGLGAPDDMDQAHLTQVWLAASDDPKALVTGKYFYHLNQMDPNPQANNNVICNEHKGVRSVKGSDLEMGQVSNLTPHF